MLSQIGAGQALSDATVIDLWLDFCARQCENKTFVARSREKMSPTSSRSYFLPMIRSALFVCLFGFAQQSNAILFTDVTAIFDDDDDLLRIAGTVSDVAPISVPFTGLFFDFDPSPQQTAVIDGGALLFTNIGGSYSTAESAISSLLVDGISGGGSSGPLSFDFLFSLPGAGSEFIGFIDAGVYDTTTRFGDQGQNLFATEAGDLEFHSQAVPAPTTLALMGLCLLGLRLRRG